MKIFEDHYLSSLDSFGAIFRELDAKLWENINHNPSEFVWRQSVSDDAFKQTESFKKFQNESEELKIQNHELSDISENVIAYFSPEIAINQSIPAYAGGLGILAGDHLKSASDMKIPMIGITLNYRYGYFKQKLSKSGVQIAEYAEILPEKHNIIPILDESGVHRFITIELPDCELKVMLYQIKFGNTFIILLDTDCDFNGNLRNITHHLYVGDRETRLLQEIVMGIGGMRALAELGIEPARIHINEGHAAFALLEKAKQLIAHKGLNLTQALEQVKSESVFTTHTPIIHGNEEFKPQLIQKYFSGKLLPEMMHPNDFMKLGLIQNGKKMFSMTVLALNLSNNVNAVSKLHTVTSNKMWNNILDNRKIKINSITNGIHFRTWISKEFDELYRQYLGSNYLENYNIDYANILESIPNNELDSARKSAKIHLIDYFNNYLITNPPAYIKRDKFKEVCTNIAEDALLIGFARRFAPYKRAELVFENMERLIPILNNKSKPIKLFISGKSHPADVDGKRLIKNIIRKIRDYSLEDKIIFLENYDIRIAKNLVSACDIWLNTPIRTLEASGTSGMKSALNGGINFSILDGWWDEAYDESNGWAIGDQNVNDLPDLALANSIYDRLENTIIPLYYSRNSESGQWYKIMRNSMNTVLKQFPSHRMLEEYNSIYKK
ncbi:MAG: alpha-glucan phosphorylase [Ignavibacteriae bacterium HGW-Ignavibacteriae-1]|jgi:starch phosphorylase|nr:MAG: alpha-glucan phosphorylase [Ignavibacteriae bacterium HGW-Ignavibacteriae-1]